MAADREPIGSSGTDPIVDEEAKDRATAVVLAWREIDWTGVESGEADAVTGLLDACERHEATRHFLEDQAGELGEKLNAGLERFYAETVGPRLRRPGVLHQLEARHSASGSGQAVEEEEGLTPRARPQVTFGHTVRMNTGCGHLYVTVNESEDGQPFELFNHMGKAGGCAASQNEAIGRLISYALRCGASLDPLIKQLKGISCHRPAWGEDGKISSCSDAIGKAIEKYRASGEARRAARAARPGEPTPQAAAVDGRDADPPGAGAERGNGNGHRWAEATRSGSAEAACVQGACVDCGGQLSYEEGCVKCHSCGFTECG